MQTTRTPKKAAAADWHPADIKAAIEKAGWSLRRLSKHQGMAAASLSMALHRPWPRAERIIADAVGIAPQTIWPSRYEPNGRPKQGRGSRHYAADDYYTAHSEPRDDESNDRQVA